MTWEVTNVGKRAICDLPPAWSNSSHFWPLLGVQAILSQALGSPWLELPHSSRVVDIYKKTTAGK